MPVSKTMLQSVLLRVLAEPNSDTRLGEGRHYLTDAVFSRFADKAKPSAQQLMSAVWSLISQGLAYIDYHQSAPSNWTLRLTEAGIDAAQDGAVNPDNSGEYLERIKRIVPNTNKVVIQYAREAVTAYNARCYLASSVMLGVASEAAFIDMASSFGGWLHLPKERERFLTILENSRQNYITKFLEFRKRIEKYKTQIPDELSDGMALTLDSVLDLLRIYRNEAGHPTGKVVNRDDAFINLQMFARYLQNLTY